MPERQYTDGEALIRYGERGDEMYLIRYGKVLAPADVFQMPRQLMS
jgi:CRP-like cAMP-binding protein